MSDIAAVFLLIAGGKALQSNPQVFPDAGTWGDWMVAFGVVGVLIWCVMAVFGLIALVSNQ